MNFIKEIEITNFFSIKNNLVINFESTNYTVENHPERVFKYDNKYYNKLISFYGANSSGKTTIIKAIAWFAYVVSNKNQEIFHKAYKNIYTNLNAKSSIKIVFILNNSEYSYEIQMISSKNNILVGLKNEILKIKNKSNNKYKILFNRKKEIFKDLNSKDIAGLLFEGLSDKTSLLVASKTRVKDYYEMLEFFRSISKFTNISGVHHVEMQLNPEDNFLLAIPFLENKKLIPLFNDITDKINVNNRDNKTTQNSHNVNLKIKDFIIQCFIAMGLDITNAKATINIDKNDTNNETSDEIAFDVQLSMFHSINSKKSLEFNLESSGTKMIMKLLYNIYMASLENSIIVFDELDSVIHPMLVPILNLISIKLNVQMIYSTHNIYNMKFLYNDELFLIEKDNKHITHINNVKEYNGFENFARLYENKILGGIPTIQNINLDF
ncbi:MAG: AAA family ATPase [Campylobacterota bacterium]|nr:AAA family ATPase [Campylobacterota bacterium]